MTPFFEFNKRGVKIPSLKMETFFRENHLYRYSPSPDCEVYVQVIDRKVRLLKKDDIIKTLFNYVDKYEFKDESQKELVHDKLSHQNGFIRSNINNWLDEIKLSFILDTTTQSFLFYQNCIVKITPEEITTHSYEEIEGNVWEGHIKDKVFTLEQPSCCHELVGPFHHFLNYLSNNHDGNLESLLSILGYILHRYKDPTRTKCVIFYDVNVNQETPNGRSCKTLLCKSINEVRNSPLENARLIDPTTKYAFSRVNVDTNSIIFDDIPKNLKFEKFFSVITGDFTKEEKFEKGIVIPFKDSPKIIITSNYIVPGEGFSHSDRRIEFFTSGFFNPDNTPLDWFEHRFFDEWTDVEYNQFFNTMVLAIQYYLKNGLIEPKLGRDYYILKNCAPEKFIEKCEECLSTDTKYSKAELLKKFQSDNPVLQSMEQYSFTSLLKKYANYKGWNVGEPHSGNEGYIIFSTKDKEKREP